MFLCSRDDKHIPLTVLPAPSDEALLGHGLQVLLYGGSVDSDCLGKGRDGYSGFCHKSVQDSARVLASERDALPIVPPDIWIPTLDEIDVVLDFFRHHLLEPVHELAGLTKAGM